MDETDFGILQAMGSTRPAGRPARRPRKPARVAERIGPGVKAMRERILAMERECTIAGYDAFPNLGLFPLGRPSPFPSRGFRRFTLLWGNQKAGQSLRRAMDKPASVWVAFHDDGAWSVRCPQDGFDGEEGSILGWTSL